MDTVFTKWLTCELWNQTTNATNHSYTATVKCNWGNLTMLPDSTREKKGIEFYSSKTMVNHYEKYSMLIWRTASQ